MTATAGFLLWLLGPGAEAAQQKLAVYGYSGLIMPDSPATGYNDLFYYPGTLITVASFAVALFAGGPLIARELESGTAQLAWTQSVPGTLARHRTRRPRGLHRPRHHPADRAVPPAVVHPQRPARRRHRPRSLYFSLGPATVAAPLLGLALGALIGLTARRTLPALAFSGFAYFLVYAFRGNHWPFQGRYQQPELSSRSRAFTSAGTEIRDPGCYDDKACLAKHDVVRFTREYLPSSDYWPRQLLETGVLLALTAVAVALAFGVLRRRAAIG